MTTLFCRPKNRNSLLVKPILGTARLMIILTSLPKSPSFRFLQWPSSAQTATLQMRRTIIRVNIKATYGQPIMKSQFRYVSVSEFQRQCRVKTNPELKYVGHADVSDRWSSPSYYMTIAILWNVITCRSVDFPTFQMNLLSPSWRQK
jgi:hypothetical protein